MSEKIIQSHGLQLLRGSPFKSSLANEFQSFTEDASYSQAVDYAKLEPELSQSEKYLQSKDITKELYYNEIGSSLLKNHELLSATLQNELSEDVDSSHLKIKLLAEHALAQLDPREKLLSLGEIQSLQQTIEQTILMKDDISKELHENFKTLKKFTSNIHSSKEMDTVNDIVNSNDQLNNQFDQVSTTILNSTKILYNQYSLAFKFCYFEDLDIALPSSSQPQVDKQTDELFSHIASIAVQRNVLLPAPPSSTNTEESNIEWAKSCLNTLLEQNYSNANTREVQATSVSDEQELTSLRTALKDLQFAHQYLTRQYEDERNLNSSVMNTHKNKKAAIEKQLAENLIILEKANQRSILIEHEKNVLERALDDRMKEVYDLQQQVALLKIDNLGYIHTNNESNSKFPSPEKSQISPVSPVTGLSITTEGKNGKYYSNPKTPLLQQNLNGSYRNASPSSPKFNNSISVLRNEFKKMVNEIHNSYKAEIEKEKIERKRLEHLLKLYEERNSDLEL